MALSPGHPLCHELLVCDEFDEAHVRPRTVQDLTIAALQSRTCQDDIVACIRLLADPVPDLLEPGLAIGVVKGNARRHLLDVFGRVEGVSFRTFPSEFL